MVATIYNENSKKVKSSFYGGYSQVIFPVLITVVFKLTMIVEQNLTHQLAHKPSLTFPSSLGSSVDAFLPANAG